MRRRLIFLILAFGAHGAVLADDAQDRQRIAAERQQLKQRFEREEALCAQQFAVNSCTLDVRQRRRQELAALRNQELQLSERQRKQLAAERLQAIERKRVEAESRSVRQRSEGIPKPPAAPASERGDGRRKGAATEAQRSAQAAERAAASQRRRDAARAERQKIEAKAAHRAAHGKPHAPLPAPSAPGAGTP